MDGYNWLYKEINEQILFNSFEISGGFGSVHFFNITTKPYVRKKTLNKMSKMILKWVLLRILTSEHVQLVSVLSHRIKNALFGKLKPVITRDLNLNGNTEFFVNQLTVIVEVTDKNHVNNLQTLVNESIVRFISDFIFPEDGFLVEVSQINGNNAFFSRNCCLRSIEFDKCSILRKN